MVDWSKWTSTRKYFTELIHLQKYVKENHIKKYDYTFTFSYGYELLLPKDN